MIGETGFINCKYVILYNLGYSFLYCRMAEPVQIQFRRFNCNSAARLWNVDDLYCVVDDENRVLVSSLKF